MVLHVPALAQHPQNRRRSLPRISGGRQRENDEGNRGHSRLGTINEASDQEAQTTGPTQGAQTPRRTRPAEDVGRPSHPPPYEENDTMTRMRQGPTAWTKTNRSGPAATTHIDVPKTGNKGTKNPNHYELPSPRIWQMLLRMVEATSIDICIHHISGISSPNQQSHFEAFKIRARAIGYEPSYAFVSFCDAVKCLPLFRKFIESELSKATGKTENKPQLVLEDQ